MAQMGRLGISRPSDGREVELYVKAAPVRAPTICRREVRVPAKVPPVAAPGYPAEGAFEPSLYRQVGVWRFR
jgi:hypothetical protein